MPKEQKNTGEQNYLTNIKIVNMKQKIKFKTYGAVALFFILVFLITLFAWKKSNAQCWPVEQKQNGAFVYAAAGMTNGFFSGEMHMGYHRNKVVLSAGYVAIPNNTQPVLFQIRAGYVIGNRWQVYAGPVRIIYDVDDKSRNSNTFTVGVQYHTLHYDRGSIYYHANYSPGFISAGVGMSFNLVNKD